MSHWYDEEHDRDPLLLLPSEVAEQHSRAQVRTIIALRKRVAELEQQISDMTTQSLKDARASTNQLLQAVLGGVFDGLPGRLPAHICGWEVWEKHGVVALVRARTEPDWISDATMMSNAKVDAALFLRAPDMEDPLREVLAQAAEALSNDDQTKYFVVPGTLR